MKKINFATQTDSDLYKYLKQYCLVIPENDKGKLIRQEAVKTLTEYQEVLMNEEDRRAKVIFHKTGDPTQGEYVFIGHNGRGYQMPFDKEVVLPESVINVCKDAIVTTYKQSSASSLGSVKHDAFEHRLYPFTIVEYMDEEGMMLKEDSESKKK